METAAQGLDQLDGKIDLLALQAGQLAFGDQQLLLHAEGVEVAADAFAVATHGQVEVGPGDIAGLALVDHLLLRERNLPRSSLTSPRAWTSVLLYWPTARS